MLTREACQTIVFGLVLSHLDYFNAILANLPANAISKMQGVQNIASCIVLQDEQATSTTTCLQKLHWVLIKQCIKFKILTLLYKCLNEEAPSCLHYLLTVNPISDQSMHTNTKFKQLIVPFMKRRTFADRSLSDVSLKYWNELPNELRILPNLEFLTHTYSRNHTIRTQTVNIYLYILSNKCYNVSIKCNIIAKRLCNNYEGCTISNK